MTTPTAAPDAAAGPASPAAPAAPDAPGAGPDAAGDAAGGPGASASPDAPASAGPDASADEGGPVGSGADAATATAQVGQGTQRRGHQRQAAANIGADLVHGDKYVFLLGGGRERLRPLSPLLTDRVRYAFEPPPRWEETRESVRDRHVVLLRGAVGHGKTAAAVRLLLGSGGPIFHLERAVDFASLAKRLEDRFDDAGIEPGTGFLLDQPEDIANLRGELLQNLETALLGAGATLVVTVDATGVADAELLTHVVDLAEPSPPAGIVGRYLAWRLGEHTGRQILADAAVAELLDWYLAEPCTRKAAADLATTLGDEYQADGLSVERVRARLDRLGSEDFEIWAEGLTDPVPRCWAIALAALNGLPHEDVAQAARALLLRLDADAAPRGAEPARALPARDPFAWPLRKLLTRLRARRAGRDDPGGGLEYLDPEYPARVLRHAWSEYGVQHVLLPWFEDLVRNSSAQVRIYAATALGGLLPASMPYVHDRSLARWAVAKDDRLREAVAYALTAAGGSEALGARVETLTAEWYADRSRPLAQATAARLYGLCPAGLTPGAGIPALLRLATVDHIRVAVAVGDAFSDLIAGDPVLAPEVLEALLGGTGDPRTRPTCLLAFLIVAASLVVEDAPGRELDGWPSLLEQATTLTAVQRPLILLWREALGDANLNREAQQVLRGWAAVAERDPALRGIFLALVAGTVHGDVRSGHIVRRCAQEWTDRDELAPLTLTAAAVADVLLHEGA